MATKKQEPRKLFAREAAVVVLYDEGRPMHFREIAQIAHDRDLIRSRGPKKRKPDLDRTIKTMRSYMTDASALPDGPFVKVEPGIYQLKDGVSKPERIARRVIANHRRTTKGRGMTKELKAIREAAERIRDASRGAKIKDDAGSILAAVRKLDPDA